MEIPVKKILDEKGGTVERASPTETVCDAVTRMNERNIGALLVMNGERVAGIFTERDVLTRVVGRRADPAKTPVGEVMTRNVISIGPATTVQQAMMVVTKHRCRHLPVIEDGRLLGMVSSGDLMRWTVRDQQSTIDDLTDYVSR